MGVFDRSAKKKKLELGLPLPPPPPPSNFEFPDIPERGELVEPEPLPVINTKEEFEKSGLRIHEPREIHFKPSKQIFVSLSDFKKINDDLLKIRSRVEEAEDSMSDLDVLYEKQQKIMLSWIKELESVETKISSADEIIKSHEKR